MAPENASLPKRKQRENRYEFDVGVRGRKTGLMLPDTGVRDEHGLEPVDHLFSSPEKPVAKSLKQINGNRKNPNATISSEEDMDVGESTIPEPTDVIAERKRSNVRLPPPRSKSPIKTFLGSPPRRHPSLGPQSSPIRDSLAIPRASSTAAPVRRRLDFSNASFDGSEDTSVSHISPQKRGGSALPSIGTTKLTNSQSFFHNSESKQDESVQEDTTMQEDEDSFQLINGGDEDMDVPEEEPEEAPEPNEEFVPMNKGKGKAQADEAKLPGGRRGRSKKQDQPVIQEEAEEEQPEISFVEKIEPVKKKARPKKSAQSPAPEKEKEPSPTPKSPEIQELPKKKGGKAKRPAVQEEQSGNARPTKRSRPSLDAPESAKIKTKSKAASTSMNRLKGKGQKPALDTIAGLDSSVIQRGPPLPRKAGLAILRRETPVEAGSTRTRSGRTSTRPVAWWKGETIEYELDANDDQFAPTKFITRTIKDVVRVDEVEPPKRHRAKSQAPRSKKRAAEPESEDEAELEPWELEPGRMTGAIRMWDPVDQLGSQTEEVEDEIALSAAAIITRDIPNATFRFAKTLTLPFFGSGMVDLPPGGIKKQKNSRKMQMVFFVHRGRVSVTVNDTAFRIGQGGMWQVPRGNFYSIENDYDKEARIFFAQGCELQDEALAAAESQ